MILRLSILIILFACIAGCKNSNKKSKLKDIKVGMTSEEVLNIAGFPDEKINLGNVLDEYSNQTHTEEWHYGDNQLIVMVNDTVNSIDLDVARTRARIQHIIDSAKAAGDNPEMIKPER